MLKEMTFLLRVYMSTNSLANPSTNLSDFFGSPSVYFVANPQCDILTGTTVGYETEMINGITRHTGKEIGIRKKDAPNFVYERYQQFDYNSKIIHVNNKVVCNLFEELKDYDYVTNLVLVIDDLSKINKITFQIDYAKFEFTLLQLKMYDILYEPIIFFNGSTERYTIKLPLWFSKSPNLSLNIDTNHEATLAVDCIDDNMQTLYIEAFVCKMGRRCEDESRRYRDIMENIQSVGQEKLINVSEEYTFNISSDNETIIDFRLPIEEIAFFYFDMDTGDVIKDAINKIRLQVYDDFTNRERTYTLEQLTGSNKFVHHNKLNKQILGLHNISFSLNPTQYQPMGNIVLGNHTKLKIIHNINDMHKDKNIQVKFVVFGRQILRRLPHKLKDPKTGYHLAYDVRTNLNFDDEYQY